MNRSNPEPDAAALMRHRRDVASVRETLRARWLFQSKNPLVAVLEANRTAILAILQSSEQAFGHLLSPTEAHGCDRPEDCCCPECRAEVDSWAIDHQGHVDLAGRALQELITVDLHPKANPYPSERDTVIDEF